MEVLYSLLMKANIGSISSGTMRPEDLIPTFISELRSQKLTRQQYTAVCAIDKAQRRRDYYGNCRESDDLDALFDLLDTFAPEYFYFGVHPGDGADYGYWLTEEWEELLEENDGIKVSDTSEIPADHVGHVAVVNDHGNITMYRRGRNHRLYEMWAIV